MQVVVRFDCPGFFLNDPRLVVRFDEQVVHDGSFKGGVRAPVEVEPGQHMIETAIYVGSLPRTKRIPVWLDADLGSGEYREAAGVEVVLSYSRLWGNFASKAQLRPVAHKP